MKERGIREVLAETFSAREFFRALSHGTPSASAGTFRTKVQILPGATSGRETSSRAGSLAWVDGVVQQILTSSAVVEAVRRGEVPPVASTRSASPQGLPVRFVDPEKLRQSPRTVLSLLTCPEQIKAAAIGALSIRCEDCRVVAPLFRRPHELCSTLLSSLRGDSAVISISSSSESLKVWGEQSGFQDSELRDGRWHLRLDSGVVNDALIVALTPILQSTWRMPDLCLIAQTSASTVRLAPHGVCPSCSRFFTAPVQSRIDFLLRRGVPSDDSSNTELSLDLGGLSLREVLDTPFGLTPLPVPLQSIVPEDLRRNLAALGLGHIPLGAITSSLSTEVLTLLVIATTLRERSSLAVIDLPHGTLPKTRIPAVEEWVAMHAAIAPCVLVGRHPTAAVHSIAEHSTNLASHGTIATLQSSSGNVPLQRGLTLLPASASFSREDSQQLAERVQPGADTSVISLGVYDSFSLKRTTLIESLELFDSLCKLFASSIDARAFGLSAKDISLRPRGSRGFACRNCGGLGVLLEHLEHISRPRASRCYACDGARFVGGAEKLLYRGLTFSQILNSTFSELLSVLSALPKSLLPLKLLKLLDLEGLPLGMPIALLSFSERRRVQLGAAALSGQSAKRPQVVVVELPFAGLSEKHAHAVEALLRDSEVSPHTCWLVRPPHQ